MSEPIQIYIISDSVGDTALNLVRAVMAQFPNQKANIERFPFVHTEEKLADVIHQAKTVNAVVVHTLAVDDLAEKADQLCRVNQIQNFDMMSPLIKVLSQRFSVSPSGEAGAMYHLNSKYFDRISALEFAVMYDDGKNPKGFLEADIVLLGVSRTSKTPLSLFLANRGFKVANLPLVPHTHLPKELFEVDPKKIVGLTNDPKVLNNIRRERMIAYGMNPDTAYSSMDKIEEELKFADELYKKLGCFVINVAHRSIEETAALILEHSGLDYYDQK